MKKEHTTDYMAQRLYMLLTGTNDPEEFHEHIAGESLENIWEKKEQHEKDDYRFAAVEFTKLIVEMLEEI